HRSRFSQAGRREDPARGRASHQGEVRDRRGSLPRGGHRRRGARGPRSRQRAARRTPCGEGPAHVRQAGGADERGRHRAEADRRGRDQAGGEEVARVAARSNAIKELRRQGQSLWLDNIRRQLITSGELARLRDEGLTGVTSNPTIFEKAVSGSTDYDEAMVHLVRAGKKPEEMLWQLMVEAYMSGLEKLHKQGGDLSRVASVASFFVSRVDTKVDKALTEKIGLSTDPAQKRALERLYGKAAIANSKMAYERFQQQFSGPRWEKLRKAGARTQRCLWASTSTKDPRYP